MYIARILYPVKVLGPGNRVGIWMVGCKHGCKGCSNPELWEFQDKYETSLETVLALIEQIAKENIIDGFTITGGDPFEQPVALKKMLLQLQKISLDILVYTGYEYDDIQKEHGDILSLVSVLIDGKYEEEKNNASCLIGSDNQKIYYLNENVKSIYEKYIKETQNQIQNFTSRDGIISVGIHRPNYQQELDIAVKKKGLEVL